MFHIVLFYLGAHPISFCYCVSTAMHCRKFYRKRKKKKKKKKKIQSTEYQETSDLPISFLDQQIHQIYLVKHRAKSNNNNNNVSIVKV